MDSKISNYNIETTLLFQKWKNVCGTVEYSEKNQQITVQIDHKNGIFIKDGVVCPPQWFSQSIRPLFFLKEAPRWKNSGDLIADHLLKNLSIHKMWQRISFWTKGIFETTTDFLLPFEDCPADTLYYGNEHLQKIAVVNVRKSDCAKCSDMNVIRAYGEFDKERLKTQLELCDPTMIICGYTSSVLDSVMGYPVRNSINRNLFYHITLNGHDVLVLDYWHPANHFPDIMNYYTLMSIYQLALKTNSSSS